METLAIVPAKSLARAKRRLADALPDAARRALAEAMLGDVLAALGQVEAVDAILVVTADPTAQLVAQLHGALTHSERADRGLNQAILSGVARARELGARQVLCVASDCPLLDPAELGELLRATSGAKDGSDREPDGMPPARRHVIVVPDRHGTGTNALLLRPPNALRPSYGPDSCARHARRAHALGLTGEVAELDSLALDVDTPTDLALLEQRLATTAGGAPCTRETIATQGYDLIFDHDCR